LNQSLDSDSESDDEEKKPIFTQPIKIENEFKQALEKLREPVAPAIKQEVSPQDMILNTLLQVIIFLN
jgi:hypothetical protein